MSKYTAHIKEIALKFAIKNEYQTVLFEKKIDIGEIYHAGFNDGIVRCMGYPQYILANIDARFLEPMECKKYNLFPY